MWLSRPLGAYYAANPIIDLEGLTAPLIMLSPHLVVGSLALTMAYVTTRGMLLSRRLGAAPVSRHAWVLLLV